MGKSRKINRVTNEHKKQPVKTTDSFQNAMARLGLGMPNMMNGTSYPLSRITQDYNLMNALYRNHWIARRIVDVIPEDMTKNWIEFNMQETPENIGKLEKEIRKTKTKERILDGLSWGRLYGGAAGLILLDGQEDVLEQPLDYDYIFPGDYKGIMVLDRWSGITPDTDIVEDINSPDFGLPKTYQITLQDGRMFRVHHSRILRFIGDKLPLWESWAEQQWGSSVIESVFDELKKRDNTSFNIANLVFLANLRIYKTDVVDLEGLGSPQQQQDFYQFMEMMNMYMNNSGMSVIGRDDDFTTSQYTFSGINDIYESFMLDVSGACGIPVTRLFGRSPAGFDSTGESDLTNYYDMIEQKQNALLSPVLDKLLPVIAMSTLGYIPEDIDYTYNPLHKADPKENADLSKSIADGVTGVYNTGLISQRTALKELRQQAGITGMWTNITDEDINKASDELEPQGEDMSGMLGGDMGGIPDSNPVQEDENSLPFQSITFDDITDRNGNVHESKSGKFVKKGNSGEGGIENSESPKKSSNVLRVLKNAKGQRIIEIKHTNIHEEPNSITQETTGKGGVNRNYYGDDGWQTKQVCNNDHGNRKRHPFGKYGEHGHDYIFDGNHNLSEKTTRELTAEEREENADIL